MITPDPKPRLAIFCDICATGVWIDGVCVDPLEDVGLSLGTADRLLAWQAIYNKRDVFDPEDPWFDLWGAWHDREGVRITALSGMKAATGSGGIEMIAPDRIKAYLD